MGRQRTIDDGTWRSMRMSGRTVEDRYALLYLLTSPFSNVVGVYELVIPIAAPEMGWDAESQLKPVLQRLTDAGFLEYDPETGFIWVCDWWLHNSARMAAGPALLKKTIDQIRQMPNQWRDAYLADFMPRLAQDSKEYGAISREFGYQNAEISPSSGHPVDRVSTPCTDPADRSAGNTNPNDIYKTTTTTTAKVIHSQEISELSKAEKSSIEASLSGIPEADAQTLIDELSAALRSPSTIKTTPTRYFGGLIKRYRGGSFVPAAGIRMAERRALEQQQAERTVNANLQKNEEEIEEESPETMQQRENLRTLRDELAQKRQDSRNRQGCIA